MWWMRLWLAIPDVISEPWNWASANSARQGFSTREETFPEQAPRQMIKPPLANSNPVNFLPKPAPASKSNELRGNRSTANEKQLPLVEKHFPRAAPGGKHHAVVATARPPDGAASRRLPSSRRRRPRDRDWCRDGGDHRRLGEHDPACPAHAGRGRSRMLPAFAPPVSPGGDHRRAGRGVARPIVGAMPPARAGVLSAVVQLEMHATRSRARRVRDAARAIRGGTGHAIHLCALVAGPPRTVAVRPGCAIGVAERPTGLGVEFDASCLGAIRLDQ